MAYMIPDKLPYSASQGEKKTFALLQNLPDDCIVYYEPIIANRYPDFIVIMPRMGILVIEVKGWRHSEIEKIDMESAIVAGISEKHPRRQAREYMFKLMDICRESGLCKNLLHESGEYQGKFLFPFAHMVVLSNIDSEQIKKSPIGDLSPFFPPEKTIYRDLLMSLVDQELSERKAEDLFNSYFELKWPLKNGEIDRGQIDSLRAVIHPDTIIEPPVYDSRNESEDSDEDDLEEVGETANTLKILDLAQEREARKIGSGHRLIWGVAGSGKTVLLISRAKLLAQENPQARILVTCFNLTLASYLKHVFEDYPSIDVTNFHALAKKIWKISFNKGETNVQFAKRLQAAVEKKKDDKHIMYDMILIDEAQDFDPAWFQSLLELLVDREDGDLVIVGDGTQGIYKSRKITWKSLGIQAQGRTTYFRTNYRNSREIVRLASLFNTKPSTDGEQESSVEAIYLDPDCGLRSTGIKPLLISAESPHKAVDNVIKVVSGLLKGEFSGKKLEAPVQPNEIAILYPALHPTIQTAFFGLLSALNKESIPNLWFGKVYQKTLVCNPGLKLMTIHSAKGLQYKAIIIFGADLMPRSDDFSSPEEDERLLYVALTRAEDYLVIVDGGAQSDFIDRMKLAAEQGLMDGM